MTSYTVGFGRVAYSIIILFLSVIASRFFSIEWYAFFREFYLYFVTGIIIASVPATNSVFYFRDRNYASLIKLAGIYFFALLAVFTVIYLIKPSDAIWIGFIASSSSLIFLLLESVVISNGKPKYSLILNLFESISFLLPLIPIVAWGGSAHLFFLIVILMSLIKIPFYTALLCFEAKSGKEDVSVKSLMSYSNPLFMNSVFGAISKQSDKFIVSIMFSSKVFSEYASGAFEIPLIARFFNGVFHQNGDNIRKLIQDEQYSKLTDLLKDILGKSLLPLVLFSLCAFLNGKFLMRAVFTSSYENGYIYFITYISVLPLRVIPFGFLLSLYGKTKELFLLSVFDAAMTALLALLLIRYFGPLGGSVSFVLATIVQCIISMVIMKKFFPYKIFAARYVNLLVFMGISSVLMFTMHFETSANLIIPFFIIIDFIIAGAVK